MSPVTGSPQWKFALVLVRVVTVSLSPVVQGLQCYSCSTDEKSPEYDAQCERKVPNKTETCLRQGSGCIFQTASNGRFVKRGCADLTFLRCVEYTFNVTLEGGRCAVKENLSPASWNAFTSCQHRRLRSLEEGPGPGQEEPVGSEAAGTDAEEAPKGRQAVEGGSAGTYVDICLCFRDKCNKNVIEPMSGDSPKVKILTVPIFAAVLALVWIR